MYVRYISVGALMSFSCKKGEFDQCFNRLDQPLKESRPDRCRSTRPISISEVDIKNKVSLTKIRSATIRVSPKTGLSKFKLFNILS